MGDFTAIGVAGEVLKEVLRKGLGETFAGSFGSDESVTLLSPKVLEGTNNDRVSLFLYHVMENGFMKNQPMERVGTDHLKYPPLSLNLYYLLTPYAGQESDAIPGWDTHTILGRAMQILYDNGSLEGPTLMGILEDIHREGYYEGIKSIRIILNPLSLDDLTKIWNSLDTPFRLSVCYEVRVVMIESERRRKFQRIVEKETNYLQIG